MDLCKTNYVLDGILGLLLLATTFSWRNHYAHLVLGTSFVLVVTVHLLLHRRWIDRQVRRAFDRRRPLTGRARANLLVDSFIGVVFAASALSSVAILLSPSPLWADLHSISSWSLFLGCWAHLALHARWVARSTRSVLTGRGTTGAAEREVVTASISETL